MRWSVNAVENAEDVFGPEINGAELEGECDAKEVLVTVTTPLAPVDAVYASVPCSSVVILESDLSVAINCFIEIGLHEMNELELT